MQKLQREYIKRLNKVMKLKNSLQGDEKETLEWFISDYRECAKQLTEALDKNINLNMQLLEKKVNQKDIEYKKRKNIEKRVNIAIKELEYIIKNIIILNNYDDCSIRLNNILKTLKGDE